MGKFEFRKRSGQYYHYQLQKLFKNIIPNNSHILVFGAKSEQLLNSIKPSHSLGINDSEEFSQISPTRYSKIKILKQNFQNITLQEKFDYVVLYDVLGKLEDVQQTFEQIQKVCNEKTRIVITYYNFIWEPLLIFAQKIGVKFKQPNQNWLSGKDIANLLNLANFEIVKQGHSILIPIYIPFVSNFINKFFVHIPILKNLCLVQYFIARKNNLKNNQDFTVSVIIPARNEEGNIEQILDRLPNLGLNTEIIFVEGGSQDKTYSTIKKCIKIFEGRKNIILLKQKGQGKGNAVRSGFKKAQGQILMILDADMTVSPEELSKFYQALRTGKGELIIGSRLVYPLEKDAMRLLNIFGNKVFSLFFSFLLDQPIKDTLCGTKVIFKDDYQKINQIRKYLGNSDPFGDFDLIFGASKLNLKICEIPIRYRARAYGKTNIRRFYHGWQLVKMTIVAARKLKFI